MHGLLAGMVVFAGLSALAWGQAGQADKPPEQQGMPAPSTLPPVAETTPQPKGKLTLTFVGAQAFKEDQLREAIKRQISDIEQSGLDDASAYDAGFFLESYYRKQGYPKVQVTSQIQGPWALTLQVAEGPLTKVGTVVIRGNQAYDDKTLTNYLLGPTRERFPETKIDTQLPFVEADIHNGTDLVSRLYAADGYLDAVIDPVATKVSPDGQSTAIRLVIHEGKQYHFGEVVLRGNTVFTGDQLRQELAADLKQPYTEGRLAAAQRKLEDFYKKRGYFAAKVDASSDRSAKKRSEVTSTFSIHEGALYHFDGITTTGLRDVKPSFIQQRFKSLSGKTYDPDLLDKKFREMIETGLFRNLRITPREVAGDQVALDITAEEARPKEVGFTVGFSSFEGYILGVSYADRNLFHSGRPLTFSAELNGLGYKGEFLYSDPWLFDTDYSFKLRIYAVTQNYEGYTKFEYGVQPMLTRKISDHWEVSAFALAKQEKITDIEIRPIELAGDPRYNIVSLGLTQKLDYRNNKVNPTKGFYFVTTVDTAQNGFGSDVSFVRGTYRLSYYLPVTSKTVLALGASGGVISVKGGPDALPIDERFFNGGASTVRSFVERELGPQDKLGFPIGGDAFTNFNIEYTFPLFGDLKGAVFGDAGNLMGAPGDFGLRQMRYAVGIGLRYNLPIGPIRLDFGYNPDRKDNEDRGAVHFSIGVAF